MTDARLKLVAALAITTLALCFTLCIIVIGMLRGMPVADTVALAALPGAITTSGMTFILGHQNGANGVKADLVKLANGGKP